MSHEAALAAVYQESRRELVGYITRMVVRPEVADHAYQIIDEGWRAHYWDRWRDYIESTKE